MKYTLTFHDVDSYIETPIVESFQTSPAVPRVGDLVYFKFNEGRRLVSNVEHRYDRLHFDEISIHVTTCDPGKVVTR